jgi:ATP-dependent Lon protease
MKNIKISPKDNSKKKKEDFIKKKINTYRQILTNTIISIQLYKTKGIFSVSELNICFNSIEHIFEELDKIDIMCNNSLKNYENIINFLQKINNDISIIFKSYGTKNLQDLLIISMGVDFNIDNSDINIFNILKKYVHPIGYKSMSYDNLSKKTTNISKNKIVEDFMIVERSKNFDCFDLARTTRNFQKKVYGIKVSIHNPKEKKILIVSGLVDDITINCVSDAFVKQKILSLYQNKPNEIEFSTQDYIRFIDSITIKEILIYNNEELYQKYIGYLNQSLLMKQKSISQNIREFINSELYGQRKILIQLLIKYNDPEFQYLAYLLYDLLSNDNNGNVDTVDQSILFDSLPWSIKKYFKDAMKMTVEYTRNLSNFETTNIPLEQQICLLKVSDKIKEKAMVKLKEIKAKSEDSGSKARQYLDGLLKIPFGFFKKEPLLHYITDINEKFKTLSINKVIKKYLPQKDRYNINEIQKYNKNIKKNIIPKINNEFIINLKKKMTNEKRDILVENICFINILIKKNKISTNRLCHSGKKNSYMKDAINNFIEKYKGVPEYMEILSSKYHLTKNISETIKQSIEYIENKTKLLTNDMTDIKNTLDESVHGHDNAKRQIERIIGQWVTGDSNGYCFGFEGAMGIGKTSIAKNGISKCLKDAEGNNRPFSFIAIGGSCNGSTLSGHNYTYVGSTWGRIVDILMETKCMNPIIFIDELDKVSKTEHGKEIIGILTHLVDATQNDSYQDKYFNGIDLDLSKVLFIFSYNDPAAVDKILLDRIHRIKFKNLDIKEKITITSKFLLPEINKKLGLNEDVIIFDDEIVTYIISHYTYEAGVRKLKEILFEISSEINLKILSNDIVSLPIIINKELVQLYLKERHEIRFKKILPNSRIGVICGLWANAHGKGGIIQIESSLFPSTAFLDLKLTGMQGDVMKESMNVSKTLAWKLTKPTIRKKFLTKIKNSKLQGIHIHCPDGATPKDGPSAGTAITICMYSLFNDIKIKNDIAITGEINLQGNVTAIGGLDLKILGGIRAGIKYFLFPKENQDDFDKFMEKYKDSPTINGIKFKSVETIEQVFSEVFDK